jgi:hypothetical protein
VSKPPSRWSCVSWACAFSSPALVVALIAFVAHTRLALGHWPIPHTEYDLGLLYDFHVLHFGFTYLFAVFGAAPLWLICLLVPGLRPSRHEWWLQPVIFLGCWAIIVVAALCDPTTFTTWFPG